MVGCPNLRPVALTRFWPADTVPPMFRRLLPGWLLAALMLLALPNRCPAPLVYRPGEGWTYESVEGPFFSSAGPDVTWSVEPSSVAMMWASEVFPKPGGPEKRQ